MTYAYVGCRIENYKSNIIQISLDDPIVYNSIQYGADNTCLFLIIILSVVIIRANVHKRVRPEPVSNTLSRSVKYRSKQEFWKS